MTVQKKHDAGSRKLVIDSNVEEIDQDRFLDRIAWMLTKACCFSNNSGLFVVPKNIKNTLQPIRNKS